MKISQTPASKSANTSPTEQKFETRQAPAYSTKDQVKLPNGFRLTTRGAAHILGERKKNQIKLQRQAEPQGGAIQGLAPLGFKGVLAWLFHRK
jgi:hypothetical protein